MGRKEGDVGEGAVGTGGGVGTGREGDVVGVRGRGVRGRDGGRVGTGRRGSGGRVGTVWEGRGWRGKISNN